MHGRRCRVAHKAALQSPRVRRIINQPTPFHPGDALKKPNLAAPMLPECDVPKMPMYGMGKSWVVIYTRDGRPYYHHPESGATQWAHPGTNVTTPPARPPETMRKPNPAVVGVLRLGGGSIAATTLFGILGGSPLLGHLMGEGSGHRVVQTRI
mmetsp:Transcript_68183/g.158230  ORF Transcript_68183/g.158230 Transcript_68183/m.158230 type:complete len:153 (-) Transcript_68183:69-527(-)